MPRAHFDFQCANSVIRQHILETFCRHGRATKHGVCLNLWDIMGKFGGQWDIMGTYCHHDFRQSAAAYENLTAENEKPMS